MNKDLVLIGHSMGCALAMRKLEDMVVQIRGLFLVAGFAGSLGRKDMDESNRSFFYSPFYWEMIRKNAKSIFVYSSDDDPYAPLENGKEIADKLGVSLTVVKGAGHFNNASGFKEFPQILQDIKGILNPDEMGKKKPL